MRKQGEHRVEESKEAEIQGEHGELEGERRIYGEHGELVLHACSPFTLCSPCFFTFSVIFLFSGSPCSGTET